jgi:TatD DNase family protein
MAPFVDSHVHLADAAFDPDRSEVIERARLTGARALLCIGESIDAARRAKSVAERYPEFVFFTAGVHPHDAHASPARALSFVSASRSPLPNARARLRHRIRRS